MPRADAVWRCKAIVGKTSQRVVNYSLDSTYVVAVHFVRKLSSRSDLLQFLRDSYKFCLYSYICFLFYSHVDNNPGFIGVIKQWGTINLSNPRYNLRKERIRNYTVFHWRGLLLLTRKGFNAPSKRIFFLSIHYKHIARSDICLSKTNRGRGGERS